MSIAKLRQAIKVAKKIQESAAATDSSTRLYKDNTVFTIPTEAISYGQLVMELRSKGSPGTKVINTGTNYTVITNNPTATANILRMLGIDITADGGVGTNVRVDNAQTELNMPGLPRDNDIRVGRDGLPDLSSNTANIEQELGESLVNKFSNKLKFAKKVLMS